DVDAVRAETVLGDVQAEIRDPAGDAGGAGALAALGIGARAEHGIAEDHGRGLHPGAVLVARGHVADLIGRAGAEHLHAAAPEKIFGAALGVDDVGGGAVYR